ncbi:MAG: hypothetical protein M1831_000070 [Alyxoria varia]|nr:MAG: hypothetical protein M1831_000070 [Alyxoria varia]
MHFTTFILPAVLSVLARAAPAPEKQLSIPGVYRPCEQECNLNDSDPTAWRLSYNVRRHDRQLEGDITGCGKQYHKCMPFLVDVDWPDNIPDWPHIPNVEEVRFARYYGENKELEAEGYGNKNLTEVVLFEARRCCGQGWRTHEDEKYHDYGHHESEKLPHDDEGFVVKQGETRAVHPPRSFHSFYVRPQKKPALEKRGEPDCDEKPKEDCDKKPKEECCKKPKEECDKKPKEECCKKPEKDCDEKPKKEWFKKPEKDCDEKPKKDCDEKPKKEWFKKPEKDCDEKPKKDCDEKPKKEWFKKPEKDCDEKPEEDCDEKPKKEWFKKPEPDCKEHPEECDY